MGVALSTWENNMMMMCCLLSELSRIVVERNGQGGGDRTLSGSRRFGYGLKLAAGAPENMTSSRRLSYCVSSRTEKRSANVWPFGCIRCAMKAIKRANSLPTISVTLSPKTPTCGCRPTKCSLTSDQKNCGAERGVMWARTVKLKYCRLVFTRNSM